MLLTFVPGDILHLHLPHLRHVAQHGEDNEPRHKACQTVDQAGHNGVPGEEEKETKQKMDHLFDSSQWTEGFGHLRDAPQVQSDHTHPLYALFFQYLTHKANPG